MPDFDAARKGVEAVQKAAEGGGGSRYTPFIGFKAGDIKTLYFITEPEETLTLQLHSYLEIPLVDDDGNPTDETRFTTLVCRKDPAFREESGNTCEICDRIGHNAKSQGVALAVELEQVTEGRRTVAVNPLMRTFETKEGEERSVPQVGLVIQSSGNFWVPMFAWMRKFDLTETSLEIERVGGDKDTKYNFFPIDLKPDLEGLELPNLLDIVARMGSEETYARELEHVKPGSQKSWGDSNKKTNKPSANRARQQDSPDLRSVFEQVAAEVGAQTADK